MKTANRVWTVFFIMHHVSVGTPDAEIATGERDAVESEMAGTTDRVWVEGDSSKTTACRCNPTVLLAGKVF